MPTFARLVAAILFGLLFWAVSVLALPLYPLAEEPEPAAFTLVNVGVAIIFGWRLGGSGAGTMNWAGAVGQGLTTTVAITVSALFLHGGIRMTELSLRKVYDGPAEAVIGTFSLMHEIGRTAATPDVLGLIVIGAALIGIITEWAGRNFA